MTDNYDHIHNATDARIADLRKAGNEIVTDKVTTGTGKHVAQYRLAIR